MVGGDDYAQLAVQPRHPGPAPAGLRVQAVRARRGAASRASRPSSAWASRKKVFDVLKARREVHGQQLQRRLRGRDHAGERDDVLRQLRLRPGRHQGRHQEDRQARAPDGHPHAGLAQLRDRRSAACKQGVTPLDMAHAYETFASGGKLDLRHAQPRRASQQGAAGARPGRHRARSAAREDDKLKPVELPDGEQAAATERKTRRVLDAERRRPGRHDPAEASSRTAPATRALDPRRDRSPARPARPRTTATPGSSAGRKEYTVAVWVGYPDKFKPMKTEFQGEPVAGGTFPAGDLEDVHARRVLKIDPLPKPRRRTTDDGRAARDRRPRRRGTAAAGHAPATPQTEARADRGRRHRRRRRPHRSSRRTRRRRSRPARSRRRTGADRGAARRRRRPTQPPGGTGAAPPRPARAQTREASAARSPGGHGRETMREPARAEAPRQLGRLGDPDPRARRRSSAPPSPAAAARSRSGRRRRSVPLRSSSIPSAWVSLPGPVQRSSTRCRPRRSRISSEPRERLQRADQHRRADALGLADRVQQRVDAVGAVDVGARPGGPNRMCVRGVSPT